MRNACECVRRKAERWLDESYSPVTPGVRFLFLGGFVESELVLGANDNGRTTVEGAERFA